MQSSIQKKVIDASIAQPLKTILFTISSVIPPGTWGIRYVCIMNNVVVLY